MIERIIEKAKTERKKVCIYAHQNPDGDAVGSASALVRYLESNGIEASYILVKDVVTSGTQLISDISVTNSVDKGSISLIVDTSTLEYAENRLFLNSSPEDTFVIDHHMNANGVSCIEDELHIPKENVVRDPTASSVCELLISEFERDKISPEIANILAYGLMKDTAKLKFVKQKTLQNLQVLLANGADYEKIISMCNQKINLRHGVGLSKLFFNTQKFDIGDTFGIVLAIDNKTVTSMKTQYRLRGIQRKIFKMSDIIDCSFVCICAENEPGKFDLEFRSSSIYGNFDVQKLATMYGGSGHYNASGCILRQEDGYNLEKIPFVIIQKVLETYSKQATGLKPITLTDTDKELASIFDATARLTKGVTPSTLSKVDELKKNGANYTYTFATLKPFERFMLENEILSRVPSAALTQRNPIVNISLSSKDVDMLCQKYNVDENGILSIINIFKDINIQYASILLPNGRKATIDVKDNVFTKQCSVKKDNSRDLSK